MNGCLGQIRGYVRAEGRSLTGGYSLHPEIIVRYCYRVEVREVIEDIMAASYNPSYILHEEEGQIRVDARDQSSNMKPSFVIRRGNGSGVISLDDMADEYAVVPLTEDAILAVSAVKEAKAPVMVDLMSLFR